MLDPDSCLNGVTMNCRAAFGDRLLHENNLREREVKWMQNCFHRQS